MAFPVLSEKFDQLVKYVHNFIQLKKRRALSNSLKKCFDKFVESMTYLTVNTKTTGRSYHHDNILMQVESLDHMLNKPEDKKDINLKENENYSSLDRHGY